MALINCKECNQQISDQAPTCPSCGCPVVSHGSVQSTGIAGYSSTTPPVYQKLPPPQPKVKPKAGIVFNTIFWLIIAGLLWFIIDEISNAPPSSSSSQPQEATTHLTGKFGTMDECLQAGLNYLNQRNLKYKLIWDKPDSVAMAIYKPDGSEITGEDNTFGCDKKETGTEGTYYTLMMYLPSEYQNQ